LAAVGLLEEVEKERPDAVGRSLSGEVVSVLLEPAYGNDSSLAAVSSISTVRDLTVFAGYHTPDLTAAGIASLAKLTNLAALRISCPGKLQDGVFHEICALKGLRRLALDASEPAHGEYFELTNLHSLAELQVRYAPGFGDQQLCLLTNLPALQNLRLAETGITQSATNVLRSMNSLTNIMARGPFR
jgi:hypothetical protein